MSGVRQSALGERVNCKGEHCRPKKIYESDKNIRLKEYNYKVKVIIL